MAIAYASARQIQRSRGHKALDRLAYLLRQDIVWSKTGQHFDYSGRPDLAASLTLVPNDCAPVGATELWTEVEAATNRKKAVLGFELLLALPMASELDLEHSLRMTATFVRDLIVDKHGLAATLAVHDPHADAKGDWDDTPVTGGPVSDTFGQIMQLAAANRHVHVMVTPSRMTPYGLSKTRYTALDPCIRGQKIYGRNWGRLWGLYQNSFFAENGLDLRVTPNPPVSLRTVPLKTVRRARKRQRHTNPMATGRSLLVNQAREEENGTQLLAIDPALAAFKMPFTRDQLRSFFQRHFADDIARELSQAAIGLGGCVELDLPDTREWFVSTNQVQHEMAAFGRALMLSGRNTSQKDVSALMAEGFDLHTKSVVQTALNGDDLTLVQTSSRAESLATDIANVAGRAGLTPVVIANGAGHPMPQAIIRTPAELRTKMVSRALIIVDDIDALDADELSTILAAALAGGNRTVLLRRTNSDWPPLELIDLIANHVKVLDWQAPSLNAQSALRVRHGPPAAHREKSAQAPRTGIVLTPKGSAVSPDKNWPRFGVDMDGTVLTAPNPIAHAIHFFASSPHSIDWRPIDLNTARDDALLVQKLRLWDPDLQAPLPSRRIENDWDDEVSPDALAIEEAAFANLEEDYSDFVPDDDPDPDASAYEDLEWSLESSEGHEPDFDDAFEPD